MISNDQKAANTGDPNTFVLATEAAIEAKAFLIEDLELPEVREQANAMSCD
jgi:hypothetical protein